MSEDDSEKVIAIENSLYSKKKVDVSNLSSKRYIKEMEDEELADEAKNKIESGKKWLNTAQVEETNTNVKKGYSGRNKLFKKKGKKAAKFNLENKKTDEVDMKPASPIF